METNKTLKIKAVLGKTETIIFLATFILMIASQCVNDAFFSVYNMATLLRSMAFVAIVGLGQTMVLLLGDIDLSVGATACLTAIVTGIMMVNWNLPPVIALVLGLLLGAACGAVNGFFITKFKITAFIVTLGTSTIFEGLVYVITQGSPILNIPNQLAFLGKGIYLGVFSSPLIIMLLLTAVFSFVLKYTPFGRQVYAIGGNATASNLVGIKVDRVRFLVFVISGTLSAVAGILMMLRLQAAQPTVGINWQMPSITAAVLGGTSMTGGRGKVAGTIIGALLITVISNAIVIMHVSTYLENVVTGAVVIIAVLVDALRIKYARR